MIPTPAAQTPITPGTPTPTPTPTPYPSYWSDYQRITFLGTSAGFPQVGFPDGRSFNVPWNLYDSLSLGDYVSFHVTGEYVPYSSTIYYVDNMMVSRYNDWGYYTRTGSAGRFCYDGRSKRVC